MSNIISAGNVFGSAHWIKSDDALKIAGIFTCLSLVISTWHIVRHLQNYSMPQVQVYVVRILLTCPIYAVTSWIALSLHNYGIYAEVVRDVYEAVVVYSFMNLILEYCGGETDCVYMMENEPRLRFPFPLCCMKPMARTMRLLRFCQRGVVQFIIVQPIVAVLNLIMLLTGVFDSTAWQAFETVVYNISYVWALYCLYVFYLAVKRNIKRFRPIAKFATVKAIVFATYYQSLFLMITLSDASEASMWNDLLLCVEMVVFATALVFAFPVSDFQGGIPDRRVLINAKDVFTVRDIVHDVYHNFTPAYSDYALQRSQGEASMINMEPGCLGASLPRPTATTPSPLHPLPPPLSEANERSPSLHSAASPVPWRCHHFAQDSGAFSLTPTPSQYSQHSPAMLIAARQGAPITTQTMTSTQTQTPTQTPTPTLTSDYAPTPRHHQPLQDKLNPVALEMAQRYRGRSARLAFNALLRGSDPVRAKLRPSRDFDAELRGSSNEQEMDQDQDQGQGQDKDQSNNKLQRREQHGEKEDHAAVYGSCDVPYMLLGRLELTVRIPVQRCSPLLQRTVMSTNSAEHNQTVLSLRERDTGRREAPVGPALLHARATARTRAEVGGAEAGPETRTGVEAPEYSGQERNGHDQLTLHRVESLEEWGEFV